MAHGGLVCVLQPLQVQYASLLQLRTIGSVRKTVEALCCPFAITTASTVMLAFLGSFLMFDKLVVAITAYTGDRAHLGWPNL